MTSDIGISLSLSAGNWGSGEWMADWKKRCGDDGAKVYGDGVIINDVPDEDGLQQCREYAAGFVKNALKAI